MRSKPNCIDVVFVFFKLPVVVFVLLYIFWSKTILRQKKVVQKSIIEQKMIFLGILIHNLKIGPKIYNRTETEISRYIST